ncbi:MAG: LysM domain-containing protein [Vicinamibacteria bacterium]
MVALFDETLRTESVVLKGAITFADGPDGETLLVSGTAAATFYKVEGLGVTAVFGAADDGKRITLLARLAPGAEWRFSDSFDGLKLSPFERLQFTGPRFLLSTDETRDPELEVPVAKGANVYVLPTGMTGPLKPALDLITGTIDPVPPVSGPLAETTDTRRLRMAMPFPDVTLSLLGLTTLQFEAPRLVLANDYAKEPPDDSSSIGAAARVHVGDVSLPLAVWLPEGFQGWRVGLSEGDSVPLPSLRDFLSVLSWTDLATALPADWLRLDGFRIDGFYAGFDLKEHRLDVFSASVTTKGAPTVWKLIPGVLELRELSGSLLVQRVKEGGGQIRTDVSGAVGGTFVIADTVVLTADLPLPIGAGNWVLQTGAEVPLPSLGDLARFVGGADLAAILPGGLGDIGAFTLTALRFVVDPAVPSLVDFSFAVESSKPWRLIPDRLEIHDIAIAMDVAQPFGARRVTGSVRGTFRIGQVDVDLDVGRDDAADDWLLAVTSSEIPLPTLRDLAGLAGIQLASQLPGGLADFSFTIHDLTLGVNLSQKSLTQFGLEIRSDNEWHLIQDRLVVRDLDALIDLDWRSGTFYSSATIAGVVDIAGFPLALSAEKPQEGGWLLSAGLEEGRKVPLLVVVNQLLKDVWDVSLPQTLLALELEQLKLTYDTGLGTYDFGAALRWPLEDLPGQPVVSAKFALASHRKTPEGELTRSGSVSGTLSINGFEVTVAYEFKTGSSSLTFTIQFRGVRLACVYSKNKDGDSLLKVSLGGVTFGGIVEYLVNLVDPSLGFSLAAPWSVLNEIRFDDLALTVNLTKKTVGVEYRLQKDLGFVFVDTIRLTFVDRAGTRTVEIEITGRFLEQEYTDDDPLRWDLLNDPPPSPSGQGDQLLDLRYLGLGQSVTFRNARDFRSIAEVMEALTSEFLPAQDQQENPLLRQSALKYAGDGRWLIGADLTLMSAVSLAGVFNDPALYGLRVGLAGPKVKALAGLEFEILYRKVTDTVGVYHIELKLPDAMRELQFGAVSVTVPIVTLDVYTNGNFRVDFGFPRGLDFSRSFCVQVFPFVGYGGFYFALLDGSTSETVPVVTNGSFAPVIEFGLALSVGVGKTIDKGILSGGATITLSTVVEGTLGWFNPNDRGLGSEMYYRIQGTAALVGKVFGEVNFVVVKADFSITARASLTLTIEAHEPILIEMVVGVEVSVGLRILFITVHFSFKAELDLSFTIGSRSTAPWRIEAGAHEEAPLLLRQQRTRHRRRGPTALELHLAAALRSGLPPRFDWTARNVFGGTVHPVPLLLAPAYTTAEAGTVLAHRDAAVAGPEVQAVMSLFAPNNIDTSARTAREVRLVRAGGAARAPFDLLVEGMLRWAIGALQPEAGPLPLAPGEGVTAAGLEEIARFFQTGDSRDQVFTYQRLTDFIRDNYVFWLQTPYAPSLDAGDPPARSATVFPMVPALSMAPEQRAAVRFWEKTCLSPEYERYLAWYFQQLRSGSPAPPPPPPLPRPSEGPCAEGDESLATAVFRDYFVMLARAGVDAARDLMKAYPYRVAGGESLDAIAQQFDGLELEVRPRPGETLGALAHRFGVRPHALRLANPGLHAARAQDAVPAGGTVTVSVGPSPATIGVANAAYPLRGLTGAAAVRLPVRRVKLQVRDGDTVARIASEFAIDDPTSIFDFLPERAFRNPNSTNPSLLRAGARLAVRPEPYVVTAGDLLGGDPLLRVAALYWVRARAGGPSTDGDAAWYAQRIADLNSPRPIEGRVDVPVAVRSADGGLRETGRTAYDVKDGDTLALVAATFALVQLAPDEAAFAAFRAAIQHPTPIVAGSTLVIPALERVVRAGDTLAAVSESLLTPLARLVPANAAAADLLAPLAVLALPELRVALGPGDTLGGIAARYDLTVEELAESVAGCTGIFEPYAESERTLTVPDVARRDVGTLVADLVADGRFNNASAMVSRFLMHGLRLPDPHDAALQTGPISPATSPRLWGLYDLSGAQFAAPPASTTGFDVVFQQQEPAAPWLRFGSPTGPTATGLVVRLDQRSLSGQYPSAVLQPRVLTGPTALPLYQETARRHPLEVGYHWQSSTVVAVGPTGATGPRGDVGQPSIWMFPETLAERIAASATGPTGATPPYDLVAAPVDAARSSEGRALARYAWAMAVPLVVRRVPADGGERPGVYLMSGADLAGRERLLAAWRYASRAGSPRDRIYLLYPPGVGSDNPQGLASDRLDLARTVLLKADLSTVTHSNALAAGAASGTYYARAESTAAFLELVWEASVTGGGFYLGYADASGRPGLPEELFATGDSATVWLLLMLDAQSRPAAPDRRLHAFNNCAVLAEPLDGPRTALIASVRDPEGADLVRVASVPAGSAGFYLTRANADPGPTGPVTPEERTRSLYNLLGYRVDANEDFTESLESLPIGPLVHEEDAFRDGPVPAHVSVDPGVWGYHQAVPVYRSGRWNTAPAVAGLPPRAENPYRGITGIAGPTGAPRGLAEARLSLQFHDVYGNQTVTEPPLPGVTVPVGYTDELAGVAAWPGAGFDYAVRPGAGDGAIELETRLSLQADRFVPGGGVGVAQASEAAKAGALRYASIFYQVQQRDLSFELLSSLGVIEVGGARLKAPLAAFVTKAVLFADAASKLEAVTLETRAETLAEAAARYGVAPGALAAANDTTRAADLFAAAVVKPRLVPAPAMNTLVALCDGEVARRFPPECTGAASGPCAGPDAAAGDPLAPEELAEHNRARPLAPGAVLRTRDRHTGLPAGLGPEARSLAAAAARLAAPVYAAVLNPDDPQGPSIPVGLVHDNYGDAVVTPSLRFTVRGVSVDTGEHPTLSTVHAQLAALALSTGDFAAAVRDVPGLLKEQATLRHATIVVPTPPSSDTGPGAPTFALDRVPADAGSTRELATLNRLVPGFFATGQPVALSYECCQPASTDTLSSVAQEALVTVAQLGAWNAASRLRPGVVLTVPDLVRLPAPDAARAAVPYTPAARDTLDLVAPLFGIDAQALAALDRHLPAVFADGVRFTVAGRTVAPRPLDSIEDAYAQLGGAVTFDAFVDALRGRGELWRTDGALAVPLPAVPDADGASPSWETLADTFGVVGDGETGAVRLLSANRCLEGFVREGAAFDAPGGGVEPVRAGAHDTVDTLLRRFREERGRTVDLAGLAGANAARAGLTRVGSPFLLPPGATRVAAPLRAVLPPAGSTGEGSVIFPVTVEVRMARQAGLVSPDFEGAAAVRESTSALAPRFRAEGGRGLSLERFAEDFEAAFGAHRLKLAVSKADRAGARPDRVFAVDFGPRGLARVAVSAWEPAFYALKPLSTALLSRTVWLREYRSGCGLGAWVSRKFDAVDLDSWMQRFFEVVDLVLTPAYAVPAFRGASGPRAPAAAALPVAGAAAGPRGLGAPSAMQELFGRSQTGCTGATVSPDGPRDYDRIVAAKGAIATGLTGDVERILTTAGATAGAGLAAAREALRQQMLTTLSSAYTVNAVVQYPAVVESPFTPGGPQAPRLSGNVTPDLYTLAAAAGGEGEPAADSLLAAADGIGVAAAYLAELVADVQGLLRAGAEVAHDGRTAVIGPFETPRQLAARFDVFLRTRADWPGWSRFFEGADGRSGVAAQRLLDPRASFPLSRVERMVATRDDLSLLADFAGVDVMALGRASQRVADLFTAGTRVAYPGHGVYVVEPGDTLVSIAEKVSAREPGTPVTVDDITFFLRDAATLTPGRRARTALPLAEVDLSTTKLDLARRPDAPLSFLLSVKNAGARRKIFLNLDYVVNEIEYGIAPVPDAPGYVSSSWLTFVLPLGSGRGAQVAVATAMPQVQVPLPLRAYPPPPSLIGQSGLPSRPGAGTLPDARRWDYRFDYEGRSADQDTDYVEVVFNQSDDPRALLAASRNDRILQALAEFAEAAPALRADLALLPGLAPGQQSPVAAVAVETLATIAEGVAQALAPIAERAVAGPQWPQETYGYRLLTASADGQLAELRLVRTEGPTGHEVWPSLLVQSPSGPTSGPDAGFLPLVFEGATGLTAGYRYPDGVATGRRLTQRVRFHDRDVIRNKNAWGGAFVTRNEDLVRVGPLGTTGWSGAVGTNPSFVYRTPVTRFIDRLYPGLVDQAAIDLSALPGPSGPPPPAPRTLDEHLANLLFALLDLGPASPLQPSSELGLLCRYAYALASRTVDGRVEQLDASVPVRLVPTFAAQSGNRDAFVAALRRSLEEWRRDTAPAGAEGALVFDATVFASAGAAALSLAVDPRPLAAGEALGATGPAGPRPILRTSQLRLPLRSIRWNATEEPASAGPRGVSE